MFEDVGEFVEGVGDSIEEGIKDFAEDVQAFLNYVGDEVSDFFTGENDEYPSETDNGNGYEKIDFPAEGIKLTPEQQKWFQDFSDRMKKENEELNDVIQEHREWKAVNMAPKYGGADSDE